MATPWRFQRSPFSSTEIAPGWNEDRHEPAGERGRVLARRQRSTRPRMRRRPRRDSRGGGSRDRPLARGLQRVFGLFVQVNARDERVEGLGIGLRRARRAAGRAARPIGLGVKRGQECRIDVPGSIPVHRSTGATVEMSRVPPARARKILIVEDNDDARHMMQMALS